MIDLSGAGGYSLDLCLKDSRGRPLHLLTVGHGQGRSETDANGEKVPGPQLIDRHDLNDIVRWVRW